MSPKRQTLLSLVFACICLSKSLLIKINIDQVNVLSHNFRNKVLNIKLRQISVFKAQKLHIFKNSICHDEVAKILKNFFEAHRLVLIFQSLVLKIKGLQMQKISTSLSRCFLFLQLSFMFSLSARYVSVHFHKGCANKGN